MYKFSGFQVVLFFSLISLSCSGVLSNNNADANCTESITMEKCKDVISSESLIIGKTWKSKIDDNEFSLVFKENEMFTYASKNGGEHKEDSYLLSTKSYKISIHGLGCSQAGIYSYSIAFREDHSQLMFEVDKDGCTGRKSTLLSNDWKINYQN